MPEFRGLRFFKDHCTPATGLLADGHELLLNGLPIRILSGAVHYFRVLPEYWRERLLQLKACGLNTVETYVAWNLHEPLPGKFNFENGLNLRRFIEIAQELDLFVILRPGPYICAEWDFGGLPSWLLHDPGMRVRTTYQPYIDAVDRFFGRILPMVADLQFTKTGPIIMVQVENEYGAYAADSQYVDVVASLIRKHNIVELLMTSDGYKDFDHGRATDVWMTVNDQHNMGEVLDQLAAAQPDRPLMVMEYWSGWFDHWNEQRHTIPVEQYAKELSAILSHGSSVNIFMFFGGTNFGFMNGGNNGLSSGMEYEPTITSYDYDALVSENGEITPKWHRTRHIFETFGLLATDLPQPPVWKEPVSYGHVQVSGWLPLSGIQTVMPKINSKQVVPMELLDYKQGYGQSHGFILYERDIPNVDGSLTIEKVCDRAIVLVNGEEKAIIEYVAGRNNTIQLKKSEQQRNMNRLSLLVENMGRTNFVRHPKTLDDQRKGIVGTVTFNSEVLSDWIITPMEFQEREVQEIAKMSAGWNSDPFGAACPALFRLQLDIAGEPADTFVDMRGWGRGVVFVNGWFNLGRYWPSAGPQQTLYLPAPVLKKNNVILIFELHQALAGVNFTKEHLLTSL
ncbi:beta-galactosidase-1-like protein 2 isoform X2 [Paramacrobiotus metropolitanus]|nr:beta-galactosidase-1-like protein 2 isoform X2 [Paramacrobiotus metropolitanus]XP_055349401.1 beta-galactosidase-1-like protein 2 isoform X2 [Paramacrobiotus metropolitanus]